MPGTINLEIKFRAMIKALGFSANKLQQAAAATLNETAEDLSNDYKRRLRRKQVIRTQFTINAVKVLKTNPVRSSGEPRKLENMNAITGVRNMRGGKDHYLLKLELGETSRGNKDTANKVPVPLDVSRTGKSANRPISRVNRLNTGAKTQTLQMSGRNIGTRGDGFTNPRRRWGALYAAKNGLRQITGDLSKPFFFLDNQNRLGIFKFFGKAARKIRMLEDSSIKPPRAPNFERAVDAVKPRLLQARFIRKATAALKRR